MKALKNSLIVLVFILGVFAVLGSGGGGSDSGDDYSPPPYNPPPPSSDKVIITSLSACSCDVSYCGYAFYVNEDVKFEFSLSNNDCNLDKLSLSFNGGSTWYAYPSSCSTFITSQCNKMNFAPGSKVSVTAKAYSKDGSIDTYYKTLTMETTTLSQGMDSDNGGWECEDSENGCFFDIDEEE